MNVRFIAWVCAGFVALGATASAQIIPGATALPDSITSNMTLTTGNVYQMVNTVKVGPGVTLTIEPGVIIYGNKNGVRSCLQVERDGKIYAVGTPERPIIFTSAQPEGSKALGDWGGILLLGKAHINATGGTAVIEGGTQGIYGGTDDADSSGVMRYVRIEYAGIAFSPNNEINGLTFGGIGNRTRIDHIQVSYANDDSYEFFGGAVNAKYMIAWSGIDDDYDTDNGFRGHLQFIFSMRDSSIVDVSTSNGMEADNDATGSTNTPISHPVISNYTQVGPYSDTLQQVGGNPLWGRSAHWRRSTRYGLFNSVLTGFPTGIYIDGAAGDLDSIFITPNSACPQPTDFRVRNTVITGNYNKYVATTGGTLLSDAQAWFACSGAGNTYAGNHNQAGLVATTPADLHHPDPRPSLSSAAATGTNYSDAMLAAGNNFTFDSVSYKGAFDPNVARNRQWDSVWSNYDPGRTVYTAVKRGWNMVATANTPTSAHKDSLFRNASSNAFRYNAGYTADNTLDQGVGYFVKLDSSYVVEQIGSAVSLPQTINVVAGWNLISSGSSEYATASATTTSGTTIQSSFFGFNGSYSAATVIEPGKAYWVKCSATGTLTFHP